MNAPSGVDVYPGNSDLTGDVQSLETHLLGSRSEDLTLCNLRDIFLNLHVYTLFLASLFTFHSK